MSFQIERHRFCSRQSFHVLYNRVLVWAVLMDHCNGSFPVGIENQPGVGVEGGCVHMIANGRVVITCPESAFITAITLLRQPRNRRRLGRSIAMLEGEAQEQSAIAVRLLACGH